MMDTVGTLAATVGPRLLRKTGDTPLSFAGRLVGLGQQEQQVGVPKWAWLGIGLVAGASVAWVFRPDIERFVRRRA